MSSTGGKLAGAAKTMLALFVFSLPLMQVGVEIGGLWSIPADWIFLLCLGLWAAALVSGSASLRWHPLFGLLLFYFAALALSAAFSESLTISSLKMAGIAYLLTVPVVTLSLTRDRDDLRRLLLSWLAASALVGLFGIVALALFYSGADSPLLEAALFGFGSLPPGDYPRLRLTFGNANMLCNYLGISVMLALLCGRLGWLKPLTVKLLLAALVPALLFTVSPGLGAAALSVALWLFLSLRRRSPGIARGILAAGLASAVAFLCAAALTPAPHAGGAAVTQIPGTDVQLYTSARVLTWVDAARTFAANFWTGRGLGTGAAGVTYMPPSGEIEQLTDAHNMFLNVAAESGIFALAAVLLITAWLIRTTLPLDDIRSPDAAIRIALGSAAVVAFAYHGLSGSFEDTRHLWMLIGLLIAAQAAEGRSRLASP